MQLPKSNLKPVPWLVVVLAGFILLAWASWGKLIHPFFDTGQEAEIAARLLRGQLLYRDVQTYYGPVAYYGNAIALSLFGHHLEVLYTVGLVLALATTVLIYHFAKTLTNAPWATLCTVYFLIYCAFAPGGLWNFIAPYSYGTVYATVLCLLAFMAVDRYAHTSKIRWLLAAAVGCGLAGLAKQEYGVAALGGVLVGANLSFPKHLPAQLKRTILITLVTAITVLLQLFLLAQQVPWDNIYNSLLPLSKTRILIESGLFSFSPTRTLALWKHTLNLFFATTLVVGMAIVAARWLNHQVWFPHPRRLRPLVELLTSVAFAWFGLLLLRINIWQGAAKIVFAASLLVWAVTVAGLWISRREWGTHSPQIRMVVKVVAIAAFTGVAWLLVRRFACCSNDVFHPLGNLAWLLPLLVGWFAIQWRQLLQHRHLALLWTLLTFCVLLYARFWFAIDFYGIYAVPAILLFFTFLYQFAPRTNTLWQYVVICLLIGGTMNLIELGQYRYPVTSAHGTLYTKEPELALAFNQTIRYIHDSQAKSVLIIPAGATLNFLTATHSPSPETIFLPGVLPTVEAQREFITRMQKQPPQLIVYLDVPLWWLKPGYQTYADYNPLVDEWIRQHRLVYTSAKLVFGEKPWNLRIYALNN